MVYDAVSQPIERRYPDGIRHTFSYDEVGNRTAMADPTGRTTTVYDDRNYPTRVTNPDDKSVTYAYDARGQRRTMTDPDGGLFTYTHDAAARLHWMENPQNQRTTFTYDGVGRQTQKNLTNGSVTKHSYFDTGRLKVLLNTTSTGTIISSFAYAYDPAGNRTSVLESDGTGVAWRYDNTYQLVNEARGTPTTTLTWDRLTADQWAAMTPDEWATMAAGLQVDGSVFNTTYTYDPVGNRLVKEDSGSPTTYTYDAANELLTEEESSGVTTYTYDECGNRDTKETPSEITYYTWNEDNRMTEAEPVAGPVTFTYDAAGRRVGKATSSDTKKFIYDFENLLQETDGSDTAQHEYTTTVEEYGDLVSEYDGTDTAYHHYNALGTTEALTDADEARTDQWVHRAFGEPESRTGTTDTPFNFVGKQGYYWDPEIDAYFVRARYYDCATGQWLSQDPIGLEGGINLYEYVGNSPLLHIDPNGEQVKPAQSVADEKRSGVFDQKRRAGGPGVPLSISLTKSGAKPFIQVTTRKPNQPKVSTTGLDYNVNPWLGRGGPGAKVGDVLRLGLGGHQVSLEWVITFRGNPYCGSWGRRVYMYSFFTLHDDGNIERPIYLPSNKSAEDTDDDNTYISGNKVYMYDQPGDPIGKSPAFLFEVWAEGWDTKNRNRISEWFYVNPNTGAFYTVNVPWKHLPPPELPPGPPPPR